MLVLCAVNPLLTGGFFYRRSIVRNCIVWFWWNVDVWLKVSTLLAQFGVSICFNPHHKRAEALMSSFMFAQTICWTNSRDARESKSHETQIMLLLCNLSFTNWWHYCPYVRWNHWSPVDSRFKGSLELNFGGSVCGDSIAGGFLSQKLGLMFSFMFALTSCLTKNKVASELKSQDAYAMPLSWVICQSHIPRGWTSVYLRCRYNESLTGRIKYKEHRFDLRDKQITCGHGYVERDFIHGR